MKTAEKLTKIAQNTPKIYNKGFAAGEQQGQASGYENGYRTGYDTGFAAGKQQCDLQPLGDILQFLDGTDIFEEAVAVLVGLQIQNGGKKLIHGRIVQIDHSLRLLFRDL